MFEKRAMLVDVTVRQWTARKHDRKVSHEVDTNHNAKDGGRFNKRLIVAEELNDITRQASTIRDYTESVTMSWGNDGRRLLPATLFMGFRDTIAEHRREFDRRVERFLAVYPDLINQAAARLGTMFNASDYPSVSYLRGAFGVRVDISPVPTSGDFRVEVGQEEAAAIRREIEAANIERQTGVTKGCAVRIKSVLQRMRDQCASKAITSAVVRDALDLVDVIDDLNVGQDPEIARIANDMRTEMVLDVDGLRRDPAARKATGDKAGELFDTLTAMWG